MRSPLARIVSLLVLVAGLVSLSACSGDAGQTNPADVGSQVQTCQLAEDCVSESPCLVAACEDGLCVFTDAPDGSVCDDGDFCTVDDHCGAGVCDGTPLICDDGLFCNGLELCDPENGACLEGAAPAVEDGNLCTVDMCDEDEDKVTHEPDDALCDDDDQCTTDVCTLAGGCSHSPYLGDCQDGDLCTENDSCVDGTCKGTPKVCDDGVFCNGQESCDGDSGECVDGVAPEVDDGIDCTLDSCDEDAGEVVHEPDQTACDDENPCTLEVCDPETGCTYENSTSGCDDGDPCTEGDLCAEGACVPGQWVCFEDCTNGEDDDADELVDCEDPDCAWELNCLDDGETCATAYPLNKGEAIALGDSVAFAASTVGKGADHQGSCSAASLKSPDTVHLLKVAEPVGVSVTVDFVGQAWPALYILADDCLQEIACQAASSTDAISVVGVFTPGDYYLVVDGNFVDGAGNGDEAKYNLTVETFAPAETETGCSNGIDDDADGLLDCADDDCDSAPQCSVVAGEGCADAKALFAGPVADTGEVVTVETSGTTKGMVDDLAGSCDADTANAPDMVYTLTLQDAMWLDASFDFDGVLYPAIYLLDAQCDNGAELGCAKAFEGAAELSLPVAAGSYFLVLDGSYGTDAGAFQLAVSLSPLADSEVDCANGLDDDLDGDSDCDDDDCAANVYCVGFPGDNCKQALPINDGKPIAESDAGLSITLSGTTAGLLDHYAGSCDDDTAGTPDLVYFMNLATPMTVNLSHDFEGNLWPALYVLGEGCGAATEFGCATGFSGAAELSLTLPAGVFYVVVDGAFAGDAGKFNFKIDFSQAPQFEVTCTDGLDEDMDGFIDCEDTDCEFELYCQDPYEPNDDFAEASVLGEVGPEGLPLAEGTMIYPAGEEDWFEFTVAAAGFVHIQAIPVADLDLKVLLHNADGVLLDTADDGYAGETESLSYAVTEPTTLVVAIDGFQNSTGDYQLLLGLELPSDTELECTDSVDNDLDGAFDCDDADCGTSPFCGAGDTCDDAVGINGGDPVGAAFDGVQLSLAGSTVGYTGATAGTCSQASGQAPEAFWKLTLEDAMLLSAVVDFSGYKYPALYVLSDACDGAEVACVAGNKEPLPMEVLLDPGTYYLVVDGNWAGDESDYTLTLLFSLVQTDETECSDGVDNDQDGVTDCDDDDCAQTDACRGLTCDFPYLVNDGVAIGVADDGLQLSYTGDTSGFSNDYAASCSDASALSPDAVYQFELAVAMNVTVAHDFQGIFWPAVTLLSGDCGTLQELACATNTADAAQVTKLLEAGAYTVVVDADFDGDEAPYDLTLLFSLPLSQEINCADGIDDDGDELTDCNDDDCALDVACAGESCQAPMLINEGQVVGAANDGQTFTMQGDTDGGQGNLAGSCHVDSAAAPDHVYVLELEDPMVVTLAHEFTGFYYPALYVMAGDCAPAFEVACATNTDAAAVIDAEILQPGLYYIVVDASFPGDAGAYTLTVSVAVVPETETECGDGKDNDGDALVDCCDDDCGLDPVCTEFHCGDGVDNDCDTFIDCDDSECEGSAFCVEQFLDYAEDFETAGSWPDGWNVDGPDAVCGWAIDDSGAASDYSMLMAYGECSETQSYRLVSPWLVLSGCNAVEVAFDERGAFSAWMVLHALGLEDGLETPPVVLDAPGVDWATVTQSFDVTDLDLGRIYFAYRGDNADDWWIDNVTVTCTAPTN
jgi:hypothetical protein